MSKHHQPLSNVEWKCLESIGQTAGGDTPAERAGIAGGRNCSESVLHRLVSRGLIEPVVESWLPLEMKRSVYRLTAAGKSLLATARNNGRE